MILIRCHTYNYHHGEALRCHHVKPASPVYSNSFGIDGVWRMLEEEEEEVVCLGGKGKEEEWWGCRGRWKVWLDGRGRLEVLWEG